MKGVSPFIATVLIIAFTIAVGGIVALWLTTFSTTTTTTVGTSGEKQIKCVGSSISVKEVRYSTSDLTLVNVTVTHDIGTEQLFNLTIEVSAGGMTNSSATVFTTTTDPFGQGESYAANVNTNITMAPEYVRVRAFCQTTVAVVGECKAGEECMKPA